MTLKKTSGMNVLVVDDNPINQIIVTQILLQWGVIITSAENGLEAIELLEKKSFDVVLMDVEMPKLGGIEATKIIREKLKVKIPVIAMTAHIGKKERDKCFEAGMDEFLSKPIDREYLLSLFDKYYDSNSIQTKKTKQAEPEDNIKQIQLDGIDIAEAVKRLNCDYMVFSEVLQNFCQFYANIASQLNIILESGDISALRREAHSLKGAASNISAVNLHLAAKELEDALELEKDEIHSSMITEIATRFKVIVKSNELLTKHIEKELSCS